MSAGVVDISPSFNLGGTGFDSGAFSFLNSGKVSANLAAGQVGVAQAQSAAQIQSEKDRNKTILIVSIIITTVIFFGIILYITTKK